MSVDSYADESVLATTRHTHTHQDKYDQLIQRFCVEIQLVLIRMRATTGDTPILLVTERGTLSVP